MSKNNRQDLKTCTETYNDVDDKDYDDDEDGELC